MSDSIPNDTDASFPTPVAPVAAPAARPRRAGLWLALLALAVLAAAFAWREWQHQRQDTRRSQALEQSGAELRQRVEDLEAALEATRRTQRALEARAGDNAATNRVLREELLGMGERATLLEETVARLAENRLRGEMILRLNEAEFLLLLGQERLRLFGDGPAAIQAYALADTALSGLDDPVLATLRQTLAQELLALRAMPADPRPALRAELARLGETVARLPASRAGEVAAADANDSRLVRLLARLVTVRRLDERDALLGPAQRDAALAALRLQLEQAQAALSRPDPAAFAHALDQAGASVARLFDAGDSAVLQAQGTLQRLRGSELLPEPPVLGATLRELRGLRAMRSAAGLPREAGDEAPAPRDATDAAPPAPEGGE